MSDQSPYAFPPPAPLAAAPAPLFQPRQAPPVVQPAPVPESTAVVPQPVVATPAIERHAIDQPAKRGPAAKDRHTVRRSIGKFIELSAADPRDVGVAAAVLAVNATDATELTVAVMTATAKDLQSVNDARSILDADQMEAGVRATALGRQRLRQVWRLFAALDVVEGEAPASEPKAAIGLVRALHETDRGRLADAIERALHLLKK